MKIILFFFLALPILTLAHTGKTNSKGCHASTYLYHCHEQKIKKNEDYYNRLLCNQIGGIIETRHYYDYGNGSSFVKIDCETDKAVIEGGLDKRSSLDSLQQALFFASMTKKRPIVVIYDTDGQLGMYEYRIARAAKRYNVSFCNYIESTIASDNLFIDCREIFLP